MLCSKSVSPNKWIYAFLVLINILFCNIGVSKEKIYGRKAKTLIPPFIISRKRGLI